MDFNQFRHGEGRNFLFNNFFTQNQVDKTVLIENQPYSNGASGPERVQTDTDL